MLEEKVKKSSDPPIGIINIRFYEKDQAAWEIWNSIPRGNRRAALLRMLLEFRYGIDSLIYENVKRALIDTLGDKQGSICITNPSNKDVEPNEEAVQSIPPEMLAFCAELNGL